VIRRTISVTLSALVPTARAVVLAAVLALPAVSAGCSGGGGSSGAFGTKVNQIRPGAPKAVVQRELGKPDEKKLGVAGAQPTGPQPPATVRGRRAVRAVGLPPGRHRVPRVHGAQHRPGPGQWEVHAVSANPRKASALER
jgi:hypothetical protein